MRFFLYDNLDKLIAIKTRCLNATLSEELGLFDSLVADFPKNTENIKDFRHTMRIGIPIKDTGEFQLFKIETPIIGDTTITLTAVDSASDDLDVQFYIDDRRLYDAKLSEALKAVFDGSTWNFELHCDDEIGSTNFYKCSRKEALQKTLKAWNVEAEFRYETTKNGISRKVCKIYKEIGQDTHKRLIKGKNVTSFSFVRDQSELYSAAIGRGAGLPMENNQGQATSGYTRSIEFDEIVWSKEAGYPVDKPKGQNYVEIPESTASYGWIDKDGKRQPRLAIIDFPDDKDPNILLEDTYAWLKARSEPQISVDTTVAKIGSVHLGDRMVAVNYDDFTLTVQARAAKIKRDLLDDNNTEVQLGNYVILSQLERDEMAKDYLEGLVNRKEDQITGDTDQKLEDQANTFNTYIGQLQDAMKKEGAEREAAVNKLREDLNLTTIDLTQKMNTGLDTLETNLGNLIDENREHADQAIQSLQENWEQTIEQVNQTFNQQVETIYGEIESIDSLMRSNTHGTIQMIKDPNDPTQINEFIANNTDGSSMQFNGNGLVYRDQSGNIQSAITSNGKIAADAISGVTGNYMTINSADINAGTISGAYIEGNTISGGTISGSSIYGTNIYGGNIYGALNFYDREGGSMTVSIGGSGIGGLYPESGGQVIYVSSTNYTSMMSSGQFAVTGSNGTTRVHPSYIEVNGNTVLHAGNWQNYISLPDAPTKSQIKGWVQDWVADYVTETAVKGHRLIIWKG